MLYLEGDLGAGKTTLVRSLLTRLGHEGKVKSPTYTFVEPYAISSLDLYHFDFYRFNSPEEFLDGGFDEYFTAPAVCLVEWPDKAAPYLPAADLRLLLDIRETGRVARLVAASPRGAQWLSILEPFLQTLLPSTPTAASCSASPPPR
ncbi:MAG: tRNA (adenosine(37)-N6)-threonylcarbamoyltransferase complex ATPase subunit type 1 TsaE [Sterolibacterium sp.]|nr:tRNA (adenosine(37)-N6)-threonylcarbamoyltransferase complex ATPase subunit type 1 TsaE [Sterolibacterium sp.]MBP9799365.1 tRNA (adenosine(37)-N6)-threonylcarbamoyltransferase complex ATPase subunit type 1 TsaE [Sterolibacterium sp.]